MEDKPQLPVGVPADDFQVFSHEFGCRIMFALREDVKTARLTAVVHISPHLLKAMSIILPRVVEKYEKDLGEIRLSDTWHRNLGKQDLDNILGG